MEVEELVSISRIHPTAVRLRESLISIHAKDLATAKLEFEGSQLQRRVGRCEWS